MSLNTKIRGLQIKDADVDTLQMKDDAITNAKLANITQGSIKVGGSADAPTDLDAKTDGQILIGDGTDVNSVAVTGDVTISNAGLTAIGATKVVDSMINDDVATGLAGDGLSASGGVIALDLNELTGAIMDVSADYIPFVDATDNSTKVETVVDLVAFMAGTGLTATAGVLSVDAITDNLVEADIKMEDESANCNGSTTIFNLTFEPVANSVQVFLNGLLQQEGSGKDYTLDAGAKTVTFTTAPVTGDILIIHYILND